MPEPRFRSRTYRRISKTLPSGKEVIHYKKRKPQGAKCAKCKVELKGLPKEVPSGLKKLSASKKSVARPYGGNLCSKCSRELLKAKARA